MNLNQLLTKLTNSVATLHRCFLCPLKHFLANLKKPDLNWCMYTHTLSLRKGSQGNDRQND